MAVYKIKIVETSSRIVYVDAENHDEAFDIAYDDYQKGDIVLDYHDFDEVELFKIPN